MTDWLRRLPLEDRLLALLVVAVSVLLVLALVFAAATLLLRLRSIRRERSRSRLESAWEPLLLAALAGDAPPDPVLRAVPRSQQLFFVSYLLRFVSRFSGEERMLVRELAQPYLPRVAQLLRHRRPEHRARAVQTLALLGGSEWEDRLVAALDDPSLTVTMVAARSLASRGGARFAPQILHRIGRFADWSPAYLASLFSNMGAGVAPVLRSLLADPRSEPLARRIAADALHDLDDIAAADIAAEAAATTDDPELGASSVRLLARVGRSEHAGIARRALESSHPLMRMRGAETLGVLGDVSDLLRLRAALDDPDPWVTLAAARALVHAGGADMLLALRREVPHHTALAAEVLGRDGRPA